MAVLLGLFGTVIGSFLNVVIYRVPRKLSVVSPPSSCPGCGSGIRGFDNVPVVSWLLLRGKCRSCSARISARYPLVEAGVGVFFGVVALWWVSSIGVSAGGISTGSITGGGATGLTADVLGGVMVLVAFLWLAAVSVALALIDIDVNRLPNAIVFPSYLVGGALLATAGTLFGDYGSLIRAGTGLVVLWAAYLAMALLYPGGMGFGDVKLAGVLGMYLGFLGWGPLLVGAFAAFLLGGIFAVGLMLARKANRTSGIPFGPWMLAGAWVGIFAGDIIWTSYLSLVGLA